MKRWFFAALGVCLLILAAWLMRQADEPLLPKTPKRNFPSFPRAQERERMEARKKYTVPRLLDSAELPHDEEVEEAQPVDPLFVALPDASEASWAVVFEANALRHSELGDMILRCLSADDEKNLANLKDDFKFDALEDLDRAAFSDGVNVITGNFSALQASLKNASPPAEGYGNHAWTVQGPGSKAIMVWNSEMLLLADDPQDIFKIIDRLEGRAEASNPILRNSMAYGEVYGLAGPELLRELMATEDPRVRQLAAAVNGVEIHVDTSEGIAMSLHAKGNDPELMNDLAKSMGAALAVQRMMKGRDSEFGRLLEDSRVRRIEGNSNFTIELAATLDTLAEQFGDCAKRDGSGSKQTPSDEPPSD